MTGQYHLPGELAVINKLSGARISFTPTHKDVLKDTGTSAKV
jgi:hypothetical protein